MLDDVKYQNNFVNLNRSLSLINFLRNLKDISIILRKKDIDLIISLHPKNGLLISISKLFFKFKNLHIITGQIWADKKNIKKFFLKYLDKFILYKSSHLLIDSNSQISFLKKEGFNTKKIKCICNGSISGIDVNNFYKSETNKRKFCIENSINTEAKIILFLGRVNDYKGIHLLLDAFKVVIDRNYSCNLLVIGDDEIDFKSKIKKLEPKYRNKIIILGHKKNINYYYSISSIFCLPSFREGFGMSVIEASSSYLPVVVSNIYGLKDSCIDKQTGLKFQKGNLFDLANKIIILLNDPIKSLELGRNGRNFVKKKFDQKDVTNFMFNYIDKII